MKRGLKIALIIIVGFLLAEFLLFGSLWKKLSGYHVLEDDMVAYYKFENSLNDSSNGNDLKTKAEISYNPGIIGKSLQSGKRVFTTWPLRPGFQHQISVAVWIQPFEKDAKQLTIIHGSGTSTSDWCDAFWLGISTKYESVYWKHDNTCGHLYKYSPEIKVGGWIHLVGTYDGLKRKIYLNGVEIAEDIPDGIYIVNQGLSIGMGSNGERIFNGSIDEVRIYNRALTAEEVKTLYEYKKENIEQAEENDSIKNNVTYEIAEGFFEDIKTPEAEEKESQCSGIICFLKKLF